MRPDDDLDEALRDVLRATAQKSSECPPEAGWLDLLQGKLEAEPAEALRRHLAECPDCAATARDARRFLAALGEPIGQEARAPGRRWLALAAAVALMAAGLGLWSARVERRADDPVARLIAELETTVPAGPLAEAGEPDLTYRGVESDSAQLRAAALKAYRERRWSTACEALERAGRGSSDERELRFLAAVSCLRAGDLDRADALLASLAAREGDRHEAARELLSRLRRARSAGEPGARR